MLELTLRLIFSLAAVIGLIMLIVRFSARRMAGRPDALVRVVQRQPLGRTASVAVVTVGSKVLVLGTTEQQVSILTELDPEELVDHRALLAAQSGQDEAESSADASTGRAATIGEVALNGSLLSPTTWKQAWAAVAPAGRQDARHEGPQR